MRTSSSPSEGMALAVRDKGGRVHRTEQGDEPRSRRILTDEETGLLCKSRLDMTLNRLLGDLKSTRSTDERAFSAQLRTSVTSTKPYPGFTRWGRVVSGTRQRR